MITFRKTNRLCCTRAVSPLNVQVQQAASSNTSADTQPNSSCSPPPGDHAGNAALGAATYVANDLGDAIKPMHHAYLGPEYSNEEIETALQKRGIATTKLPSSTWSATCWPKAKSSPGSREEWNSARARSATAASSATRP